MKTMHRKLSVFKNHFDFTLIHLKNHFEAKLSQLLHHPNRIARIITLDNHLDIMISAILKP
jgi:hypothetical protein